MRYRHLPGMAALLLVLAGSQPSMGADWSPLSREEALQKLGSTSAAERRAGLGRLAEVGVSDDVPLMLQKLWDEDETVRGMAEQALWGLWLRANDSTLDPMFQVSIDLIRQHKISAAIATLNEVITAKPDFAEAWNKRGDAYSIVGDYDRALADYQHALELNPYHFGVLQSCGDIWLERRDLRKAAHFFRRALELNPNLWDVALTLRELERRLENDKI
ncbi:MAG TPA: tetratricopeptide repeat protein [Burkholderiales bacterium]|jgi:tetratricopeptide (TPR) repeat protein|nr:tetratricopeptide repeat protein [Burkholderiales bacterium]